MKKKTYLQKKKLQNVLQFIKFFRGKPKYGILLHFENLYPKVTSNAFLLSDRFNLRSKLTALPKDIHEPLVSEFYRRFSVGLTSGRDGCVYFEVLYLKPRVSQPDKDGFFDDPSVEDTLEDLNEEKGLLEKALSVMCKSDSRAVSDFKYLVRKKGLYLHSTVIPKCYHQINLSYDIYGRGVTSRFTTAIPISRTGIIRSARERLDYIETLGVV